MASDNDFFVIRRFEASNARVLLMMQDRIAYLEEEIRKKDDICETNSWSNGTLRYDVLDDRRKVLEELASRLERYSQYSIHDSSAPPSMIYYLSLIR